MNLVFDECFTEIKMLIKNGYEHWYISNFEMGFEFTKWYRAESSGEMESDKLAKLNVTMGPLLQVCIDVEVIS